MNSDNIKRISIRKFQELGFLQEVNRLVLHPLGLALEVVFNEDGTENFAEPWDYRDDPEGLLFMEDVVGDELAKIKAESIKNLRDSKKKSRLLTGLCAESGIQKIKGFEDG